MMEIPVIPPSIMLLGIRNISSPMAASTEPNIIRKTLEIRVRIWLR